MTPLLCCVVVLLLFIVMYDYADDTCLYHCSVRSAATGVYVDAAQATVGGDRGIYMPLYYYRDDGDACVVMCGAPRRLAALPCWEGVRTGGVDC